MIHEEVQGQRVHRHQGSYRTLLTIPLIRRPLQLPFSSGAALAIFSKRLLSRPSFPIVCVISLQHFPTSLRYGFDQSLVSSTASSFSVGPSHQKVVSASVIYFWAACCLASALSASMSI